MPKIQLVTVLGSADPETPIETWAQDHWSTFGYLETCCVDGDGRVSLEKMRCGEHHWRPLGHFLEGVFTKVQGTGYPTRLRGGILLEGHDDWDCVSDFIRLGLVYATYDTDVVDRIEGNNGPTCNTRGKIVTVKFSQRGSDLSGLLRAHKAREGTWHSFDVPAAFYAAVAP